MERKEKGRNEKNVGLLLKLIQLGNFNKLQLYILLPSVMLGLCGYAVGAYVCMWRGEKKKKTWWPRWAAKLPFIYMLDIKPNKPGSSTDIIMCICAKNSSAHSITWYSEFQTGHRLLKWYTRGENSLPVYWNKLS